MSDAAPTPAPNPERMFPFVLKAGILIADRTKLQRSKGKLHFVLITRDISETSRNAVLADFRHYPVVQNYLTTDLEKFFGLRDTRAIGFTKSGLAQSIYAELKQYRINQPVTPAKKEVPPAQAD